MIVSWAPNPSLIIKGPLQWRTLNSSPFKGTLNILLKANPLLILKAPNVGSKPRNATPGPMGVRM